MTAHEQQLVSLYRELSSYALEAGASEHHAMHRMLSLDGTTEPSPLVLDGLIANHVTHETNVLDAGCGFAGTLIRLSQSKGIRGVGVTISEEQQRVALQNIDRYSLSERLNVVCADYNHHDFSTSFDHIVTVESLHHNTNPRSTVLKLLGHLDERHGSMIVVDDFPRSAAVKDSPLYNEFVEGWRLGDIDPIEDFCRFLSHEGYDAEAHDLTQFVPIVERDRPIREDGVSDVMDANLQGSYALEQLFAKGMVQYGLIVIRRGGGGG